MADLTNAMKGVIQSSTARTSSTYASTDLIQLYDSNNEPTIKISKDDLMSSVKAALPSLLSDQGTSGTAFPSIASGVLGSMTAANLASVLGAQIGWGGALKESADNIYTTSSYYVYGDTSKNTPTGHGVLITQCCSLTGTYGPSVVQTFYDNVGTNLFIRIANSGNWGDWRQL